MSNPSTIRGWLDLVEGHLSSIATNTASINAALRSLPPPNDIPLTGERTIADLLYRTLTVNDSEFGDGARFPLTPLIAQHLGASYDSSFRQFLLNALGDMQYLPGLAEAVGANEFGGGDPTLYARIGSLLFGVSETLNQLSSGATGGTLRNRVEDIQDVLEQLLARPTPTEAAQQQTNTLLQQLLDCSCPDVVVPTEPAICDGTNGFLVVRNWQLADPDDPNGYVWYGNVEGTLEIGDYTFTSGPLSGFGLPFTVQGFQAVKNGASPITIDYCMEWAGDSAGYAAAEMLPFDEARFWNGGVRILQPAPASETDRDQVFGGTDAERSTYIVYISGPRTLTGTPEGSVIFITPLIPS